MGYPYINNEGKVIGEQISIFDLLDDEEEDDTYYDDDEDEE